MKFHFVIGFITRRGYLHTRPNLHLGLTHYGDNALADKILLETVEEYPRFPWKVIKLHAP